MSQLVMAFDVVNQSFVGNYKGSAAALPSFRQGTYPIRLYLVQPSLTPIPGNRSYDPFDASDFDGLRFGIWKNSTGTLDDEDENLLALASELDWTYNQADPANPFWEVAEFVTHTEEVADWIGTANNKAAYLAINLVKDGKLIPVFDQRGQTNITLYSATDGGSGVVPISMISEVPTMKLPVQFLDEATGELFALVRVSPGLLQFTHLNP